MKRLKIMQWFLVIWISLTAGQSLAAETSAMLDWYQRMELSTPVSGIIDQVYVEEGQRVEKNQRLIKLDDRGFRAQVKKAESVLTRANETFTEAKREMDRAQELFERTSISVHERELVRIDFAKAQASQSEAQADLTHAKLELEYSEIHSPVAGIVVQLYAHKNQTIVNRFQAKPLLVIAATGRMLARATVSASELDGLNTGMQVDIKVQGQVLSGKIKKIGLEPSRSDQPALYTIEAEFPAAGKIYRKGQAAIIILP